MENTKLWDSVCKTDPSHTKKFTKGGGFSGTAIKPFYLMHKATETFGVCGIGWGWKELENTVVGGVWCSKVELWFIHNNQRGAIEQWGQTVMQGKNKNGDFVDEEAPKKAITDAVTKCLSYLGFAGDVHMGRFDDSKYIDERNKEEKQESSAAHQRRMNAMLDGLEKSDNPTQYWITNKALIDEYLEFPEKEMVENNLAKVAFKSVCTLLESSDDPAETWHIHSRVIDKIKSIDVKLFNDLSEASMKRKMELEK